MNDQFFILMYQAARDVVQKFPQQLNVIAIGAHSTLFTVSENLCKNRLWLRFEDLDTEIEVYPQYPYPQKEHIVEAINFARNNFIHIIHCSAGVSRSPAIGYVILRDQGYSKEEAMNMVIEKVPQAIPNKRIVDIYEKMLS